MHVFRDTEFNAIRGTAPHYVGLQESILLGRALGLHVAEEVIIVGVEIADCLTLGGEMHPAVRAAIPEVIQIVQRALCEPSSLLASPA